MASIPHGDAAWMEGLLVRDGDLWEGTGLKGRSQVRLLDTKTGAVILLVPNDKGSYGEGAGTVTASVLTSTICPPEYFQILT